MRLFLHSLPDTRLSRAISCGNLVGEIFDGSKRRLAAFQNLRIVSPVAPAPAWEIVNSHAADARPQK
jgi:hypothetical protein